MATKGKASKSSDERREWTLTSPAGNDYTVTSPVDYYNLKAQGYADADAKANADTLKAAEAGATEQALGPADGVTAVPTADAGKG